MQASPNRPTPAFSLIELLITITIVAVLASVSFPAYTQIRKTAEWAKTPGRMTAIITSFHDYATEHNGYFPPAWNGTDERSRWLNSTIYSQVYPSSSGAKGLDFSEGDIAAGRTDTADNTDKSFSGSTGAHLRDTIFIAPGAVVAKPNETNFYNLSFLLNRSLITDAFNKQNPWAPRKFTLFTDDSATMLLTEGPEGDHNSIGFEDAESQLEEGYARYDGKFIHVGFLDGHVERIKRKDFPTGPETGSEDDLDAIAATYFWTGVNPRDYLRSTGGSSTKVKY